MNFFSSETRFVKEFARAYFDTFVIFEENDIHGVRSVAKLWSSLCADQEVLKMFDAGA